MWPWKPRNERAQEQVQTQQREELRRQQREQLGFEEKRRLVWMFVKQAIEGGERFVLITNTVGYEWPRLLKAAVSVANEIQADGLSFASQPTGANGYTHSVDALVITLSRHPTTGRIVA